ncbi:hypothetical protein [Pantoea ananatis]|uniref:hypothetical protein n=1 Tax=Pantoea ananas TaxID=553 RepID=UPI000B7E686D|nr:hypothetical protein [Pantoea ananatis]
MKDKSKKIKRRLGQICEAFSALEFAYRNYSDQKDAADIVSIIGVSTSSGMTAFEELEYEINALLAEISEK